MSVSDAGSAGNWEQDPARPHNHPGMPTSAWWFWCAVSHPPRRPPPDLPTYAQHDGEDRGDCDDPRCQRASRGVDRARQQQGMRPRAT